MSGSTEENGVSAPQSSAAISQPAALGPRPTTFSQATILNPGLSEDYPRRPIRAPAPNLVKESAFRAVVERISQSDKEVDVSAEDAARSMLDELMNEFLTDVGTEAARLAKRRKSNAVHGRDLGLVLNKRYGLNVPGGNGGAVVPVQQGGTAAGNEHTKRMAAVRKMNMQANRQRFR